MGITPEQRARFLSEVRSGADIKTAAEVAGIHRPRVYTLRDRDPRFAAELEQARAAARPAPGPRYDDRAGLARIDETLDRDMITEFVKALRRTGRIPAACLEVGIDMFPDRVKPGDLSPKQRAAVRDLLAALDEPPPPPVGSAEKQALERWLRGESWSRDELDIPELRKLSPRAASDYERVLLIREAERAANDGQHPPS